MLRPALATGYFFILFYAFSIHGVILTRNDGGECVSMDKQHIMKLKQQKPHISSGAIV